VAATTPPATTPAASPPPAPVKSREILAGSAGCRKKGFWI
jgi:hypothetical protein